MIEVREAKNYAPAKSPYLGYLGFWGVTAADKLTIGADYGARMYVDPAAFPNGTVITWNTPLQMAAATTPRGYLHLARGNQSGQTFPKLPDPVKALGDIAALPISWDVEVMAAGDFALLSDTFTFTDASLKVKAGEAGVFGIIGAQSRAYAMGPQSSPVRGGRFIDPTGRAWLVRRLPGNYVMIFPEEGDALKFSGDLKWFFDFLMGAGLAKAGDLYAGTGLGIEPTSGAGMARFNTYAAPAP